jgi:hypothetical protein
MTVNISSSVGTNLILSQLQTVTICNCSVFSRNLIRRRLVSPMALLRFPLNFDQKQRIHSLLDTFPVNTWFSPMLDQKQN